MNAAQLRYETTLWRRLQKGYEQRAYKIMQKAFDEILTEIPWKRLTYGNYADTLREFGSYDRIYTALWDVYNNLGVYHGIYTLNRVEEFLEREKAHPFFNRAFQQLLADYLSSFEMQNKIVIMERSLSRYVIRWIARRLLDFENQEDDNFVDVIKELFEATRSGGFYKYQIARIVRTESTAAANYGALQAGLNAGIKMNKVWISSLDKRTRRIPGDDFDHLDAHGQQVDIKEMFEIENVETGDFEKLEFPGDRRGSAENVINCRCTVSLVPKDLGNRGGLVLTSPENLERIRRQAREAGNYRAPNLLNIRNE